MALTVNLPPELEQRLTQEAQRQSISADAYALQLLDKHLPPKDRQAELVALLQDWIDNANGEGQKETGDYLVSALDTDRLSK